MIFRIPLKLQGNLLTLLLLFTVGLVSCHKEKDILPDKPGEIFSFKIEVGYNKTILATDVEGVIKDKSITLAIPKGLNLKNIIATFDFTGKSVQVNGSKQVSKETSNNFENGLTYSVLNNDDVVVNYTVKVVPFDDDGLTLAAFSFETKYNTALSRDYILEISDSNITATIIPTAPKILVASYVTNAKDVFINSVKQEGSKSVVDFSAPVVYTVVSATGFKKDYRVTINWNYNIPHIYIITENNEPITSKDDYLQASIKIEGNGGYDDYSSTTKIRGRGNTTWGLPKKPYRLKLDKKASLFGLPESKNWVLLANYLDGTLMLNAVAMKTGKLLEIPYTNNIVPVDVTVNNQFAGSYMFTEQVEVDANRVNIADGGVLLEIDQNFDEIWEFKSNNYQLPVMVKYPSLTTQTELDQIKNQFHQLEDLVAASNFPNNNYADYIETTSIVNYLIVHNLTDNEEINHPKSTYMYRPQNGKFTMGPLWDFDWAYGYEGSFTYFSSYTDPLFWSSRPEEGTSFFSRFVTDPNIKTLYKQKWAAFKKDKLPLLLQYVDEYANRIENSKKTDYILWHTGSGDFKSDINKLRTWIQNRADYIDVYMSGL